VILGSNDSLTYVIISERLFNFFTSGKKTQVYEGGQRDSWNGIPAELFNYLEREKE
jgi:hypothetical protein